MDSTNNGGLMQITVEEIAMLLGKKDIEIHALQKEISSLRALLEAANAPAATETGSAADKGQEPSQQ